MATKSRRAFIVSFLLVGSNSSSQVASLTAIRRARNRDLYVRCNRHIDDRERMAGSSGEDEGLPVSSAEEMLEEVSSSWAAEAVAFAQLVGRLKTTPRTGWVRRGVPRYESVADHSWRVAVLSLLLGDDAANGDDSCVRIDVAKCMQMAVVHDLAECLVGDIAPSDNISNDDKRRMEEEAIRNIAATLRRATGGSDPGKQSMSESMLMKLFHEYEERATNEAVAVKDLDLLDMILQANEYEERFGTDLTEFFDGTPVTRFRNPTLRRIASQVHQQRGARVQNERQGSKDLQHCLSNSDNAFVAEYAKASNLGADAITEIVQALRRWELPK